MAVDLAAAVVQGDRQALARAVTLVESRREADAIAAEELLQELLPHTGNSIRVGITGAPGVGAGHEASLQRNDSAASQVV